MKCVNVTSYIYITAIRKNIYYKITFTIAIKSVIVTVVDQKFNFGIINFSSNQQLRQIIWKNILIPTCLAVTMIAMTSEGYLEYSRTCMMELFCKDSRKLSSQKCSIIHIWFDWVLNAPQDMIVIKIHQ